jgi:hypothetical protein
VIANVRLLPVVCPAGGMLLIGAGVGMWWHRKRTKLVHLLHKVETDVLLLYPWMAQVGPCVCMFCLLFFAFFCFDFI